MTKHPYGKMLPPGWSVRLVDPLRQVYSVFDDDGVHRCDQGWAPLDAFTREGHLAALWHRYFKEHPL